MIKGIGLGIGFILGIIATVIVFSLIITVIFFLYKFSLRKRFSKELFYDYRKYLIEKERFEELEKVKKIIKKLEKNETAKNLMQEYKIDVDSYLYWMPYKGGERLTLRHDKRIIRKYKKN